VSVGSSTSLLATAVSERRTDGHIDRREPRSSVCHRRAGAPVHLIGHSFGGSSCLSVAMRNRVELSSSPCWATAFDVLPCAEEPRYREVVMMGDSHCDVLPGPEAARRVIDFYGGDGSFDAMPQRMRDYIVATTPRNIIDWASVFGQRSSLADYGRISVPSLVVQGADAHPCVARAAEIAAGAIGDTTLVTLPNASHFMMATHPREVAALIEEHVATAECGMSRVRATVV
jgi:pimeloyl-ACP methyl ester carboxylesterase